MTWRFC